MLFCTLLTLMGLTIATNCEMLTLGVVTNTGADAFQMFGNERGVIDHRTMDERFSQIDKDGNGEIDTDEATYFLSKQNHSVPLNTIMFKFKNFMNMKGHRMKTIVLMILIVALFKASMLFFSRYTTRLLALRISKDLRQHYFEHLQTLPMSFFARYNIGTLSSRVVGDAHQISLSINSWITNYLHAPFTMIAALVWCFYLSWQLSMIIFIAVPLVFFPIMLVTKKVKQITRKLQRNQENFASVLIDFLAGIQTVKIFAMEAFTLQKYKEQNDRMLHLESKSAKYDLLTRPILHAITTFSLIFIFMIGLYVLHVNLSELLVFCGLLHTAYEPIKKFADENANVQKGVVAAERLYEVLSISPEVDDSPNAKELSHFESEITFDRVWFKYSDQWVLKDLSFTVKKGETVAIVGATGSGKSSILQLIPRLYDVDRGYILIDGVRLKDLKQASLRKQIAYVSQRPFHFNDTVSANIAYGNDLTQEEIELASKRAHAHEFIVNLPKGYESTLSEMGKNLSGGQQQRLAIARALAKQSPILILDEATSALDSVSEDKVKQAITELHGEMTQIIVAHRLTTIEHADRIIYIAHGEKVAEGTKEELYATCEPFKLMWDLHFNRTQEGVLVQ